MNIALALTKTLASAVIKKEGKIQNDLWGKKKN